MTPPGRRLRVTRSSTAPGFANQQNSHLAYAPEIASAMLQRQQASAVIAARQKIVEGAVGAEVRFHAPSLSRLPRSGQCWRPNAASARRRDLVRALQSGDADQAAHLHAEEDQEHAPDACHRVEVLLQRVSDEAH